MSWENCSLHTQKKSMELTRLFSDRFFFFCLVLQPIHLNLKFQVLNSHKLVCVWTGLIPKSFLTSKPNGILVSIHVKALGDSQVSCFKDSLFDLMWPNEFKCTWSYGQTLLWSTKCLRRFYENNFIFVSTWMRAHKFVSLRKPTSITCIQVQK